MGQSNNDPLLEAISGKLAEWDIHPGSSHILIGVSGGMDSMVLLHTLHALGYTISVAHVNYQLRGTDSDLDADVVKKWCADHHVPFFEKVVDTKAYMDQHRENIQKAARQIRYTWWEELMNEHSFTHVATAHHLDDDIETFLLNLLRGSGIKGLAGIPARRDKYLRPLLGVAHLLIENYASAHNVPYRIDKSNESDAYQRNRIRHHLIPLMKELSNHSGSSFLEQTLNRIKVEWDAWEIAFEKWKEENIEESEDHFKVSMQDATKGFALRWLENQGIPWMLAKDYIEGTHTGKYLTYGNWKLSRNDHGFYLETVKEFKTYSIDEPGIYAIDTGSISIELIPSFDGNFSDDPTVQYMNTRIVNFPLIIRPVEPGDAFRPFGMNGNHKKLQDFLVDAKLDLFEKDHVRVLTSHGKILWVVGMRPDESVRVNPGVQEVYKVQYIKKEP